MGSLARIDTYKAVKKFEANGFSETQAATMVDFIAEALQSENIATRDDIEKATTNLNVKIAEVKAEITEVKSELKQDIAEVKAEITEVKSELKQDIAEVKAEIKAMEYRLLLKMIYTMAGVFSVIGGILLAIAKVMFR